jgi:MBOAT, membrane-bound O-acyltransferase family
VVEAGDLLQTGSALALVLGAGACSFPFLRMPRGTRIAALSLLAIPVFLAPLLVPLPFTELRFVVALMSIAVGLKLYDLHRTVETGPPPWAWAFLTYLPNGCNMVFRSVAAQKRPPRRADAIRLLWLAPIAVPCALGVIAVWRFDWRPYSWAVADWVKAIAICAFIQFGSNVGASALRLLGIPASDFSGWFSAAATPAEFWRRWNRPAGRFLFEYVYVPAGGWRRLYLAVMATFALNGLIHEYVFGIAAGRVLGWAFLFFLIQGLATAATFRLRPRGWGKVIGILLTLLFNLATSLLLFACVDAVVP